VTDEAEATASVAASGMDPYSPWHVRDHWWLNTSLERELPFIAGGLAMPVRVSGGGVAWQLTMGDHRITAKATRAPDGRMEMVLGDARELVSVVHVADSITVRRDGETWRLQLPDPIAAAEDDETGGRLVAPIPGQVTQVLAKPGMAVARGQVMVVLEAMKTVFRLAAPSDGVIETVSCRAGDSVVEGQLLVGFAEGDSPTSPE
jgi:3-methylcrotonyl-CoA carboxylase alpha subunit